MLCIYITKFINMIFIIILDSLALVLIVLATLWIKKHWLKTSGKVYYKIEIIRPVRRNIRKIAVKNIKVLNIN